LLDAAGSEAPPAELVLSMQQALGIAASGATAAVAAKSSAAAWLSAGIAVTALGVGFGAWQLSRPSEVPLSPRVGLPAPALATATVAPDRAREPGPAQVAAVSTPAVEAATPAPAMPQGKLQKTPAAELKRDLRQEIELIDRARAAVSRRAPEQALEALRQYVADYPRGAFAPEAQVLRIEALEQSGRHAQARTLAKGFLAKHPDSPLAERVAKSVGSKRAD
jgi:TolA-binding protein